MLDRRITTHADREVNDVELINEYNEPEMVLAKELARDDGLIWDRGETLAPQPESIDTETPAPMTEDDKRRYLETARRELTKP